MARDDILKVSGTTPAQRAAWRARAQAAGLSTAAWVREAADAAAATGVTAADLRAELVRLRADLGRGVGSDLDRIARGINADLEAGLVADAAAHERALAEASKEVTAARRAVERMLRRLEPPRPARARAAQ